MRPEQKVTPKHGSASEPQRSRSLVPDSSLTSGSPQQIIERLRNVISQLDRLPLPIGATGGLLLDALELTDQIRDRIRDKARHLLLDDPDRIEGWHVETQTIYRLCRDKERKELDA